MAETAKARVGRRHGTSRAAAFDRWFRYPAGFAADHVSSLLSNMQLPAGGTLVDPFAGSAVAGTAARAMGLGYYGVEAHPLIAELGRLKFSRPGELVEVDGLPARKTGIAPQGTLDAVSDESLLTTAARVTDRAKELLAEAPEDITNDEAQLIRRSFDQATLELLIALRAAINELRESPWRLHLKWALLASLRDVAVVKVGWPYQRPAVQRRATWNDVSARFLQRASHMAADLNGVLEPVRPGTVTTGDSRAEESWSALDVASASGCLTSPPYLNNFDYADATRLELYFWTQLDTWRSMCDEVRGDMLTASTQQSHKPDAEKALLDLGEWPTVQAQCASLTARLTSARRERKRGKEYDQVLPEYLLGIGQVVRQVARTLAPEAPFVLVVGDSAPYGVYIDTPALIAQLGEPFGLTLESDASLRHRGARWTSTARHGVELSERIVTLRKVGEL